MNVTIISISPTLLAGLGASAGDLLGALSPILSQYVCIMYSY